MKARLSELAREFTWTAFATLVDVCENGQSETARIAAATALLDRGFGKPREAHHEQYHEPTAIADMLDSAIMMKCSGSDMI